MNQKKNEEFVSYWIRIKSKAIEPRAVEPRKLNFYTYVIHFGDNRWPCPPHCLDASGIGQAFTLTTPLLTFFFLVVSWWVFGATSEIPWLKLALWSLVGGGLAGFLLGFLYVWKFNRTVRGNHLAIDRDELKEVIREVQAESK